MVIKIAHLTTVDLSLRYLLLNQLIFLQNSEYKITGISSEGPNIDEILTAGIRHIPVRMTRRYLTPLQDVMALWKLFKIFKKEEFTIVHVHTPKASLLGQISAKLAGTPIIIRTLHGYYLHENMNPILRWIIIKLETIASKCSDKILSQNSEDIETAITNRICDSNKIEYLGNGIDIKRFDQTRINKQRRLKLLNEFHLDDKIPVIGFVGRLVEEKGIVDLLKAINIIKKQEEIQVLLVGQTDQEKTDAITPKIASEYYVGDVCKFVGFQDDMPEIYSLMDIFVLPSHREGFPRTAMEASAMKIPCVVSNIRGCREVVEHEINGLIFPLGDIKALAQAIVSLLEDKKKATEMGENGRKIAEERFDEKKIFMKVKKVYDVHLQNEGLIPYKG